MQADLEPLLQDIRAAIPASILGITGQLWVRLDPLVATLPEGCVTRENAVAGIVQGALQALCEANGWEWTICRHNFPGEGYGHYTADVTRKSSETRTVHDGDSAVAALAAAVVAAIQAEASHAG